MLTNEARTGNRIVAVAVFDVNSVRKVSSTDITKTIAKFGTESRAANWQPSHMERPDS